ncbi:hypothetical protein G647_10415 [Cladophialophora carrionii CBS 160.54]|uniref:Uncharacterized protein n=1 Tax=Cladophialophora carrionii CBS 160.54 TaxID=1279043 RepID=V9DIU8_9EURO|nr:uncharacterized protein G647_10415 [Cladophialophora carrionii CBS 160.54]ETI26601.1 hypothetical protein G647_10415 [Cladophialophora carrionii CBS 160.54]
MVTCFEAQLENEAKKVIDGFDISTLTNYFGKQLESVFPGNIYADVSESQLRTVAGCESATDDVDPTV